MSQTATQAVASTVVKKAIPSTVDEGWGKTAESAVQGASTRAKGARISQARQLRLLRGTINNAPSMTQIAKLGAE